MTLCFATNNLHKISEVQALVGSGFPLMGLQDIGCLEELAEEQNTLEGNAWQKASYVFEHYHVSCFADDTGLEVKALGGAPGVFSARYAGPQRSADDNIRVLLNNLENHSDRSAQFRTVICLMQDSQPHYFEGVLSGTIIHEKRGTNGFGYDPVFVPNGQSRTLAEMTLAEKNTISHRAQAMQKFIMYLHQLTS